MFIGELIGYVYSLRKESLMPMRFMIILMTIIINILMCTSAVLSAPYGATKSAVVTVPEGQIIRTIVTTPLSSNHLSLGQNVTMVLGEDFYYNDKLVAPMDSVVYGSVIRVNKATTVEDGKLLLRFTRITTPYGIQVPVSAIVKNNNKIGMLSGVDNGLDSSNRDVDIPVTTPVDLILIQPITVNPEIYNTNY